MPLYYNKMNEDAFDFTKKVASDACYDIYTSEDSGPIRSGKIKMLSTGIRLLIPEGFEVVIRPRSGLSTKWNNYVSNSPGTIDAHYRGEVKISFANNTPEDIENIQKGTKIAQLGMRRLPDYEAIEISSEEYEKQKSISDRRGGFGSSGDRADG